jgi:hypothetical protein
VTGFRKGIAHTGGETWHGGECHRSTEFQLRLEKYKPLRQVREIEREMSYSSADVDEGLRQLY